MDEEEREAPGLGHDLCGRGDLVETSATPEQGFIKDGALCRECALGAAIEETALQQRGRKPCLVCLEGFSNGPLTARGQFQERPQGGFEIGQSRSVVGGKAGCRVALLPHRSSW